MHESRQRLALFLTLALLLSGSVVGASLAWGPARIAPGGVSVSLFPYYLLARSLTEHTDITVTLVIPRGESPHTYVSRPADVERVQASRLVFVDGLHDTSIAKLAEGSGANGPRVVALSPEASGHDHAHHHDHGHDHEEGEPVHAWLDPVLARQMAGTMARSLTESYPAAATKIEANRARLDERLARLDEELRRRAAPVAGRGFLAFHSAFNVLAERYGLRVLPPVQLKIGVSPTARHIEDLRARALAGQVRVLFTEPQLSDNNARILAEELGMRLYTVDPIGGAEDADYPAFISTAMSTLVEALSAE